MSPVNRRVAIPGTLLMSIAPLWAQVGTVRVRVTSPDGSSIPKATVSLRDAGGRTLATVETNDAGEAVWTRLALGNWYFLAEIPGFSLAVAGIAICDHDLEHTIALKLTPIPERDLERITVDSAAAMIETIPVPFCQALDLPPPPKTTTHHWWQIFR
jgi:hypothetical protein